MANYPLQTSRNHHGLNVWSVHSIVEFLPILENFNWQRRTNAVQAVNEFLLF